MATKKDLSPKQLTALALLVKGHTQDEVASVVKVKPVTIREWLKGCT
jgi:DNA-binding CsgD family transcriptional regulator